MRIDIEHFPQDTQSWKWRRGRWIVGLLSFWVINIILMFIYPNYSIGYVFLLMLLFMIFGVFTYREGYQNLFAYRLWLFGGFFLAGLLFLGLNYLTKIILADLAHSVSIVMIKRIIIYVLKTQLLVL